MKDDDLKFFQQGAHFGALTTQAFASLCIRLMRRCAMQPGFPAEFDAWSAEIIKEMKSATPVGTAVPIEIEAAATRDAIASIEKQFADWHGQLTRAHK